MDFAHGGRAEARDMHWWSGNGIVQNGSLFSCVCGMFASKEKQRNVVPFLVAEEMGVPEVEAVYRENSISLTRLQDWHNHFHEWRESVKRVLVNVISSSHLWTAEKGIEGFSFWQRSHG